MTLVKAVALAILFCVLRVALFDWQLFTLQALPNHDILSGAAAFASSMHSLRISGDIAWWLPSLTDGGYAQYYNHFLSPLAPTAGHPPFLLWSYAVRGLAFAGVAIPEYFQFLAFNYVLAPILAYAAFALLALRYCGTWLAATLALGCYALGGPGIWNNSWMFYQEWFCIFLLLLALDLTIASATRAHLALLGTAALIVAASLNYWTVFASWYVAAFATGLLVAYRGGVRRAVRTAWHDRTRSSMAVGAVTLSITLLWVVLIGLVYIEQAKVYQRGDDNAFSVEEAVERAHTGAAADLSEFFRPELHPQDQPAHRARYIGIGLVPLIVAFLFGIRRGRDAVLITALVASSMVVMASGLFVLLDRVTPGMPAIRHVFYFYLYFVQITLILIAARVFGHLHRYLAHMRWTAPGLAALALVGFASAFATDDHNATPALLALVSAVLLFPVRSPRLAPIFAALFVVFVVSDLGRYYRVAELMDQQFTLRYREIKLVNGRLPAATVLAQPWAAITQRTPTDAGVFANMPMPTEFWPINAFSPAAAVKAFSRLPEPEQDRLRPDGFMTGATIIKQTYNEITADILADAGNAVANLLYDPAWRLTVDDAVVPTHPTNIRMTGFPLKAGRHTIALSYRPQSRDMYFWLAPVTLIWLSLLMFAGVKAYPRRLAMKLNHCPP